MSENELEDISHIKKCAKCSKPVKKCGTCNKPKPVGKQGLNRDRTLHNMFRSFETQLKAASMQREVEKVRLIRDFLKIMDYIF